MSAQTPPSCAHLALHQSPLPLLRRLRLEESETTVVIHGQVSSYYLKQLAQETLRPVLGGRKLVNQVLVVREQVTEDF
jgi:hypothetical protein